MTTTTKTRKQSEISAPAIFRICDKVSHDCIGYGVPSDSQPGTTYFVRWDYSRHQYECNCKSVKPCKHIRAVQSVLAAKKVLAAPAHLVAFFEALASFVQSEEDALVLMEAEMLLREEEAPAPVAVKSQPVTVTVASRTPVIAKAPTITAQRDTAPLGSNSGFSLMR